jgi:uncharacterized membrane protein
VFRNIKVIDRAVLFCNLALLMVVVAIPFATAMVAEYLREGHAGNVAVAIYSAIMLAHALTWMALWWWVSRHPALLADHVDPDLARKALWRFGVGTPVYALAVLFSFVSARFTLLGHFIVAVIYSFEQLRVDRPGARSSPDGVGESLQMDAEERELLDSE